MSSLDRNGGEHRQPTSPTPLDHVLDIFRVGQYFHLAVRAADVAEAAWGDVRFVDEVRRAFLPVHVPFRRSRPTPASPFPPPERLDAPAFAGKRVGLLASGGSGALASVVGVARALEEAEVTPAVIATCSGASLFGFPLAAGMPSDEVAEFVLGLRPEDYIDVDWPGIARIPFTAGRGFAALIRGDKLEAAYRKVLGDRRLRDLRIPAYAPIWNVERNRVDYLGPRTFPDVPVAVAVRVSVALPPFYRPVRLDGGGHWCDGGLVDIFPASPLLDIEEPCDAVLGVNCFYPPGFVGENATGWEHRPLSILALASQERSCQHLALARESLERLQRETRLTMVDPVPYDVIRGAGFYRQFIDTSAWPAFMAEGRAAARRALATTPMPVKRRSAAR